MKSGVNDQVVEIVRRMSQRELDRLIATLRSIPPHIQEAIAKRRAELLDLSKP